jgi:predicted transcriptional regulator
MNTGTRKPGRPPLPANVRLGERVVVRLSPGDAAQLETLARQLRTTTATVVRLALAQLVRSQEAAC